MEAKLSVRPEGQITNVLVLLQKAHPRMPLSWEAGTVPCHWALGWGELPSEIRVFSCVCQQVGAHYFARLE